MAVTVEAGVVKNFSARFVDASGNPTTVDTRAPAQLGSSDPARVVFSNVAADGLSGQVTFSGVGPVQMTMTVDADRGDGVRALTLTADVDVLAGEAVGGTIDIT